MWYKTRNYKKHILLINSHYMNSSLGKPDYYSNVEITFQIKSTSKTTVISPIAGLIPYMAILIYIETYSSYSYMCY